MRSPCVSILTGGGEEPVDISDGGTLNNGASIVNIGKITVPTVVLTSDPIVVSDTAYTIDGNNVSTITSITGGSEGDFLSLLIINGPVTFVHSAGLNMGGNNVTVSELENIAFYKGDAGVWVKFGVYGDSGGQIVATSDEVVIKPSVTMRTDAGGITQNNGLISSTPVEITGPTIYLYSNSYWCESTLAEINAVSGTFPDFTEIGIFFKGATILKHNSTFEPPYGADWTSKDGDTITLKWNERGDSLWRVRFVKRADGSTFIDTGGTYEQKGTEVIPTPTEITMDNQIVYGTGNWKVGAATPAQLTSFAPPPGNVNATFTMTVEDVVRLVNANAGVSVPTVNGQIVFNGYTWIDPIFGDVVYFRYDPNFNNSGVGAWVVNEVYFRH